jgi:hypothetical protein
MAFLGVSQLLAVEEAFQLFGHVLEDAAIL